jgi:hypothetical protein
MPEDPITVRDKWSAFFVAAAGTLLLMPRAFWGLPFGKAVCGSLRVLDGQVPYRDFWTMYAPGQFYAIAGLFRIFGREALVQAIAVVVINGAVGGLTFLVARRAGVKRPLAVAVSLVMVISFWLFSKELTTYPPAILCALFAVERVLCYFSNGGPGKLFSAGLLLGIGACFKHDVAFYISTAMIMTLFISWFALGRSRPPAWTHPFRASFVLVAGAALIILPAITMLALYAGEHAWQMLIVWPATDFRGVRTEGIPALPDWPALWKWMGDWGDLRKARDAVFGQSHWILCNMPLYVFVVAAGYLAFAWRRIAPKKLVSSLLFLIIIPFFWIVAHVQPNTHVFTMAVVSLCLMALAWPKTDATAPRQKLLKAVIGTGMAVYTVGLIASPVSSWARIALRWSDRQYLGLQGARGIWVSKDRYDVYYPIVSFIRKHVPPDERIYVGLKRHDSPVINDLIFYYLTGRKNCCRYDELHPGITDRADVQQEIIDSIEKHNVRCVVIWCFGWSDERLDDIKEANMAAIPGLGNTYLDTFISETFVPIARYGEYMLMWRRGMTPPEVATPGSDCQKIAM